MRASSRRGTIRPCPLVRRSRELLLAVLAILALALGLTVAVAGQSVIQMIGREVWPDKPRRALAAAAFAAAYPVVYRMSVLFHPEMPFALLCALAVLVFLKASRREDGRTGLAGGSARRAARRP